MTFISADVQAIVAILQVTKTSPGVAAALIGLCCALAAQPLGILHLAQNLGLAAMNSHDRELRPATPPLSRAKCV